MFCGIVILLSGFPRIHDTFPVVLNVFIKFTIDCRPEICPRGGTANCKQKARCEAMIEWAFEKWASTQNYLSSRVYCVMASDRRSDTNLTSAPISHAHYPLSSTDSATSACNANDRAPPCI